MARLLQAAEARRPAARSAAAITEAVRCLQTDVDRCKLM